MKTNKIGIYEGVKLHHVVFDPGIIEKNKIYKLQRYDIGSQNEIIVMENDTNGKWVAWEHVKPLLQAYLSIVNKENNNG